MIGSVDQALGNRLERVVVAHHRRRLERLGQLGALDGLAGGWAAGHPPPRQGNALEVLVDGSEALPAIATAISEARERVWLAGWHFTPEFRVGETGLRELLADAAARVEGTAAVDVADHFALRWAEVTGEPLQVGPVEEQGEVEVQVVRTVPNSVYDRLPRGDFRILESYLRAIRSAERLIYLESQFLWSYEFVSVLAEKLRNPPADDFRVVVVLPARPHNGQEDTRGQLGV